MLAGAVLAALALEDRIDTDLESDYLLDLVSYKERSLVTHAQRSRPRIMLKTPGMSRKRSKILELFKIIQAAHAPGLRKDAARDFVDDIVSLHISEPQFLPETDLLFVFVTPIIASIYLESGPRSHGPPGARRSDGSPRPCRSLGVPWLPAWQSVSPPIAAQRLCLASWQMWST